MSLEVSQVRQGWTEFLSRYPWDVFGTLTFRVPTGWEGVLRSLRYWLTCWALAEAQASGLVLARRPGRSCRLPRQYQPIWCLGIEPHKTGRLHAHTLLKFPKCLPDWNRQLGWQLWYELKGLGRLEPPRCRDDVGQYVSKYVTKPGSDLVLSDSFDAAHMPGVVLSGKRTGGPYAS